MILCSDDVTDAKTLALRGFPVPASFAVFSATDGDRPGGETWLLAEPDAFEETLCRENATLTVDCARGSKFTVRSLEKTGGGAVDRQMMHEILASAVEKWRLC